MSVVQANREKWVIGGKKCRAAGSAPEKAKTPFFREALLIIKDLFNNNVSSSVGLCRLSGRPTLENNFFFP